MVHQRMVAIAAALLLAGLVSISLGQPKTDAKVGEKAPAFSLHDQNGRTVSLSDYAGKIVVLEWFNEDCPIVQGHYKDDAMNKLARRYAEKGVVWLAINSTSGKTNQTNQKADSAWKMSRPILNDSAGTVGHAYGATNTPGMFIVNKNGVLAYMGGIDDNESGDKKQVKNYVAQALDELLAGKAVSQPQTKQYGCTVKYAN
jgi:peroxiredoxin